MTDTGVTDDETTEETGSSDVVETGDAGGAEAAEVGFEGAGDGHLALGAGAPPEDPLKDRFVLPLVLPLLCILAVALYTLNISRVFLAGDSTTALVIATVITIGILAGGSIISASPRLRTPSLAMFMALVVVVVVGAGLLSLGPSLEHGEGEAHGYVEPEGPADYTVEVEAGPGLAFNGVAFTERYETGPGITEIRYVGERGHTLVFTDPALAGFKLDTDGVKPKGKVDLQAGEYTIYCDVLGHRAGGMEATFVVGEG